MGSKEQNSENYELKLTNKSNQIGLAQLNTKDSSFKKCFTIKPFVDESGTEQYYIKKSKVILTECNTFDSYQQWTYTPKSSLIYQKGPDGKSYCWHAKFGKIFILNCRYKAHQSGSKLFNYKNGQIQVVKDDGNEPKVVSYVPGSEEAIYK